MTHPFFTIGHSTRSIEDFVALLREADAALVVDVRTVPRSRKNPQYNSDTLPATLATFKLDYTHIAELGGLRSHIRDVPETTNGFWENTSFHNYADYAMTGAFRSGLRKLRMAGRAQRCAIMCAEAVWWRCHRRIIADYLIAAGETVIHILARGRMQPAVRTGVARSGPKGTLIYPQA
jgi:uncharacterized protein (DUF488 family)